MRSALMGMLLAASAAAAQPLPVLQFEPPRGFTGSLGAGDAVEGRVAGGELRIDNMTFKKAALK